MLQSSDADGVFSTSQPGRGGAPRPRAASGASEHGLGGRGARRPALLRVGRDGTSTDAWAERGARTWGASTHKNVGTRGGSAANSTAVPPVSKDKEKRLTP